MWTLRYGLTHWFIASGVEPSLTLETLGFYFRSIGRSGRCVMEELLCLGREKTMVDARERGPDFV